MLNSMEADSFTRALLRFINRRGKVRELRSDQGTNLVGAKSLPKIAIGYIST